MIKLVKKERSSAGNATQNRCLPPQVAAAVNSLFAKENQFIRSSKRNLLLCERAQSFYLCSLSHNNRYNSSNAPARLIWQKLPLPMATAPACAIARLEPTLSPMLLPRSHLCSCSRWCHTPSNAEDTLLPMLSLSPTLRRPCYC